jgi:transposase
MFYKFVADILRQDGGSLIAVLDRLGVHRSAAKRLLRRFPKRFFVEWLPAYAPELNPTEGIWRQAKYADLANYIPPDVGALGKAVRRSIRKTSRRKQLLKSFFDHAELRL